MSETKLDSVLSDDQVKRLMTAFGMLSASKGGSMYADAYAAMSELYNYRMMEHLRSDPAGKETK